MKEMKRSTKGGTFHFSTCSGLSCRMMIGPEEFDPTQLEADQITVELEVGPSVLMVYGTLLKIFMNIKVCKNQLAGTVHSRHHSVIAKHLFGVLWFIAACVVWEILVQYCEQLKLGQNLVWFMSSLEHSTSILKCC